MSENSNSIFRAILTGSAWSFVGVLLAVAFFYWQEYRNPYSFKIEVVDEFNLIEVREQISDLKILYKNDDIIESKKEIKVIRIQIRNEGDTILQGYYDQLEPFGLRFSNSKVLNAEVISTNSEDLQQKLVNSDAGNKNSDVLLSKVIFDAGDYATLKITILSDEREILNIVPLGKIANVDSLKVDVIQPEADEEKPVGLYVVGGYIGFILFLFGLIAITEFFETRSKKNKVKCFLKDGESLTEVQSEIADYYMDMPPSQKRLIKALLNNDIALDLKQVIEAQTPKHSPIERILLLPLVITRVNRLRLQNLPKDIFSTDGVTVSFNKENEDFIRSFFGAVL
jgi:hypothetical protein